MPARPALFSLPQLLAACTALALARFGAWAKLGTLDAFTWQVVRVDPCDPGVVLTDHPSAVGETPDAAALAFCDALHELNLADAAAADERAAEVLAHRLAHPEIEGPEPSPLPGDDGRFDARPRSLADAFPGLPFAFTVTAEGDVLDAASGALLSPAAEAAPVADAPKPRPRKASRRRPAAAADVEAHVRRLLGALAGELLGLLGRELVTRARKGGA